jgi:hypothetical protein
VNADEEVEEEHEDAAAKLSDQVRHREHEQLPQHQRQGEFVKKAPKMQPNPFFVKTNT